MAAAVEDSTKVATAEGAPTTAAIEVIGGAEESSYGSSDLQFGLRNAGYPEGSASEGSKILSSLLQALDCELNSVPKDYYQTATAEDTDYHRNSEASCAEYSTSSADADNSSCACSAAT